MKTLVIIESAKQNVKNFAQNLRDANKEYTSLSRVLKDMQRKDLLKAGYADCFKAVGMPTDGSITPAVFLATLTKEQLGTSYNKKGEVVDSDWVGIWGTKQSVDPKTGEKVVDEKGAPVVEAVLRKVTSWTPSKIVKCLAQAQAIKGEAKKA